MAVSSCLVPGPGVIRQEISDLEYENLICKESNGVWDLDCMHVYRFA